ncbi:hypothetical protein MLD38_024267 [Melastoma candidum]|uniref:Uncharacterized protein n=1 Tax=Melastoma candidum TaxID=119954 RepID=A0ACB9NS54_9MYRT|nr:hypothetical protein MLD38_024267 [Melastoma candidum]
MAGGFCLTPFSYLVGRTDPSSSVSIFGWWKATASLGFFRPQSHHRLLILLPIRRLPAGHRLFCVFELGFRGTSSSQAPPKDMHWKRIPQGRGQCGNLLEIRRKDGFVVVPCRAVMVVLHECCPLKPSEDNLDDSVCGVLNADVHEGSDVKNLVDYAKENLNYIDIWVQIVLCIHKYKQCRIKCLYL